MVLWSQVLKPSTREARALCVRSHSGDVKEQKRGFVNELQTLRGLFMRINIDTLPCSTTYCLDCYSRKVLTVIRSLKKQLHGHLLSILQIIHETRTILAGHAWGINDDLICDNLQWTAKHRSPSIGRSFKTCIQQRDTR